MTHAAKTAVAAIIGTMATNSAVVKSAVVGNTVTRGLLPLKGRTVAEDAAEPSLEALCPACRGREHTEPNEPLKHPQLRWLLEVTLAHWLLEEMLAHCPRCLCMT